jgi:hypothetical protein
MAGTGRARSGGDGRRRLADGAVAVALVAAGVAAAYALTGDDGQAPATRVLSRAFTDPSPATTVHQDLGDARPDGPASVQSSDNAFSFAYLRAGQRGGASSIDPRAGQGVLAFEVQGVVVADTPPAAALRATLVNQRSSAVAFPGGLDVVVKATRNGQPWADVHLRNPAVTTLAPGQQADVSAEVALPGFGSYALTGQVTYVGA